MDKKTKIAKLRKQLKAAHTKGARSNAEHSIRQHLRKLGSYVRPESMRENLRQARTGTHHSLETIAKISKTRLAQCKKGIGVPPKKKQGGTNATKEKS